MAIVLINKNGDRFPLSGAVPGSGTGNGCGSDLMVNGSLRVWQRYDAADSASYTNPTGSYVADRFRCTGTGTIRPNPRGYGADITGSITLQYWMEAADFAQLPDPVTVYYSVDGVMDSLRAAKGEVPLDSGGNACVFQKTVTDGTLDWVSLHPALPARPFAQELALCQRYYQQIFFKSPVLKENTTALLYSSQTCRYWTPMRAAPTAKYRANDAGDAGMRYYSAHSNAPTISPSGFTAIKSEYIKPVFSLPSGISFAAGDFVQTTFFLDAEIY